MSVSAAERFFSLLALVAAAGAITIVVLWIVPGTRPSLARIYAAAPWLAWLVAATSMFGSLYFSEHAHFEPCKLCWYQRIAMYSLVVVLLVGNLRRDRANVAWYAFDETSGTSAADSFGNGKTATLAGTTSWVAGRSGNAVHLDGASGYVRLPNGLLSGAGDFTVSAWVRLDSVVTWTRVFDFGTGTVSWRWKPEKVTLTDEVANIIARIDAMIARMVEAGDAANAMAYSCFLRVPDREIDKDGMRKHPDLARAIEGVKIGRGGETFEVEPFAPQLAGAAE